MRLCIGLALWAAAVTAAAADGPDAPSAPRWQAKVDPWVLSSAAHGETEFLVFLSEQADLVGADLLEAKEARGQFVFERLTETAERTQRAVLELLEARGVEHQRFWVANMIKARGDLGLAEELALRDDVAHLYANPWLPLRPSGAEVAVDAAESRVADQDPLQMPAAADSVQTVVVNTVPPATYAEWIQWFIAATILADPMLDPAKAPRVVLSEWTCSPREGCTDPGLLRAIAENARAAGITLAADLALTSTPWPRRMRTGHVLSYTLTVTNAGPQAAGSVVVRQNIPVMFFPGIQVTSSQGVCDLAGVNIRCDLGIVAAGSSATVDVSATARFPETATSIAEAWSSEPDGNPGNNTLAFTIRTVDCPPLAFCR